MGRVRQFGHALARICMVTNAEPLGISGVSLCEGLPVARTEILVNRLLMPMILDQLEARFRVHRWWEIQEADRAAFLAEHAKGIRGIAYSHDGSHLDDSAMAQFPKLEIVSNFGVGYDSIDAKAAAARKITVTNTPDVLTEEVADLTIGLVLATVRRLPQADAYLRRGDWMRAPFPLSPTLRGQKVGIVGLGRIGKAIAKRLEAFDLAIAYHGRSKQMDVAYPYHPSVEALAEAVDILIIVAPGGPETRHVVGAKVMKALGPRGTLINVARGSLVDEVALAAALRSGELGAAGLDVFEVEPCVPRDLIGMENVVLLPHIGSASIHTRNMMGQLTVDNLVSWFEQGKPLTPVAETPWPL
jgi:lactate dehydrogenase-like 2-hydroxyacid dehydrogenase